MGGEGSSDRGSGSRARGSIARRVQGIGWGPRRVEKEVSHMWVGEASRGRGWRMGLLGGPACWCWGQCSGGQV